MIKHVTLRKHYLKISFIKAPAEAFESSQEKKYNFHRVVKNIFITIFASQWQDYWWCVEHSDPITSMLVRSIFLRRSPRKSREEPPAWHRVNSACRSSRARQAAKKKMGGIWRRSIVSLLFVFPFATFHIAYSWWTNM